MHQDIPLYLSILFVAVGFAALVWSSDIFVVSASVLANAMKISPFIVGMVVIGFGTSAPELCVSVMSGLSRHSGVSLGNAYGSCIFNIAGILGVAAFIRPLLIKRSSAFVAGPVLAGLAALSYFLMKDGSLSRCDALLLLVLFAILLPLYCWFDQKNNSEDPSQCSPLRKRVREDRRYKKVMLRRVVFAAVKVVVGLSVLVGSSHILVWGAVDIANFFKVDELIIGLTIVAVGTSLPELASAIAAARHGEHEFVLGNIIGSNFFNTLAVTGIAAFITPVEHVSKAVVQRDIPVMIALSLSILLFGINFKNFHDSGVAGRFKGLFWLAVFVVYTIVLLYQGV